MTSPVERLLPRLENVRETSESCWVAKCPGPTHRNGDRRPSLSIKEVEGRRLLMHCFAGCETHSVLSAINLELRDLYPERLTDTMSSLSVKRQKRYGQALDVLAGLDIECLIVSIAAERILASEPIDAEEIERLRLARSRIMRALELAA